MRIVVLVKTIPDLSQARISTSQGRVITAGAPILNPRDLEALAGALQMRRQAQEGEITTITLAEPAVAGSLKKLATLGADQMCLVDSTGIAVEDPGCRARVLAAAVRRLGVVDHIVAGAGSITGGGGATAYAVAELLSYAARAQIGALAEVPPPPSLVTVAPQAFTPPTATITAIARAAKVPVTRWTAADLALTSNEVGPEAACVRVRRSYLPDEGASKSRLATSSGEGALPPPEWSGLLVVGQGQGSRLTPGTTGTLAVATELAQLLGARVTLVLVGAEAADRAIRYGADVVKTCASADCLPDQLQALVTAEHPEAILWEDTPPARLLAARLSVRLRTGCVLGATYIALDAEQRQLVFTQSLYEGRLAQEVAIPARPQLATVAAGAQATPVPDAAHTGTVCAL